MSLASHARRLRRRDVVRPFAAGAAGVALGALLGLVVLLWPRAAAPPPAPPGRDPLDGLERALAEARRNCALARGRLPGGGGPLFEVDALAQALDANPLLLEAEHGELPGLRAEARWLGGLRLTSPLDERSWEDVRFLLGFVHWYLECAYTDARREATPGLPAPPDLLHVHEDHDPERLRAFRGLGYPDLLGEVD